MQGARAARCDKTKRKQTKLNAEGGGVEKIPDINKIKIRSDANRDKSIVQVCLHERAFVVGEGETKIKMKLPGKREMRAFCPATINSELPLRPFPPPRH